MRDRSQRKVIRLQHYDYAGNGLYFVTICIQNRLCLLGQIYEDNVDLTPAGKMVENCYLELERHFKTVRCLNYVIMPNHIHFVVQIENIKGINAVSLFDIIQRFKSKTNVEYIKNVKANNWTPFSQRLWQRSYYEHIVRDERDYLNIVEYIENNPFNWHKDELFHL